jgi:hypothetical protein
MQAYVASVMLITLAVGGQSVLPVGFLRVTGAHEPELTADAAGQS